MTVTLLLLALLVFSSSSQPFAHGQTPVTTASGVGFFAFGVAYDSGKGELFLSNFNGGTVAILSDTTNAIVANVTVGNYPEGIAYDSGKGEVFVADSGSNAVSVISDSTDAVISTVTVGSNPDAVAYDSGKGEVFVANHGSDTVSVISDGTNEITATIPLSGQTCNGIAYDSAKGEVFVTCGENVAVISDSTNSVLANVMVGDNPTGGVAYDSSKGEVFVTSFNATLGVADVSVISDTTNSVVAKVPVGSEPSSVVYDSRTGEIFVGDPIGTVSLPGGDVFVINDLTNQVAASISVGDADAMAYDSGKGEIFVASSSGLSIISDSTIATITGTSTSAATSPTCTGSGQGGPGTVAAGAYPTGLAYDSGNGEVYVGDYSGPTVTAVCDSNNSVVSTIYVPALNNPGFQGVASPQYVTYDSGRGEIFVANIHGNSVTVISDRNNSVVATVGLGNDSENLGQGVSPIYLAYDSGKGEIFVANSGLYTQNATQGTEASTVSVISDATNTVVTTLPEGDGINGIAYDSGKGEVFVATTLANNTGIISVISDSTNSVVATIRSSELGAMAYDSANGEMFVVGGTGVDVISDATNTVIANIPVKDGGDIAYDSGKGEMFVVTADTNTTTIISAATNSVIGTASAGPIPYDITYDSAKGELFVTNPTANNVTIISDSPSTGSSATTASSAKSSSISLSPAYATVAAINAAVLLVLAGAVAMRRGSRFTAFHPRRSASGRALL